MELPFEPPLRSVNANIDEDEDEDGLLPPYHQCLLLQRNDPDLDDISFGTGTNCLLPHADDWGKFGDCISRNTHLKSIVFDYLELEDLETKPTLEQYQQLCNRISGNKSIETLTIGGLPFSGEALPALIPFLKNNPNLISIEIDEVDLEGGAGLFLAGALASFHTLRSFCIVPTSICADASQEITKALSGHQCLKELRMHRVLQKFRKSYEALALLLQKCGVLETLVLYGGVGDECASILAVSLASNKSLKVLELRLTDIGKTGWFALSTLLMNRSINIESISFLGSGSDDHVGINTEAFSSMASNLAYSKKLKKLDLSCNRRIGWTGWKSLFEYLADPSCVLEDLDIAHTNICNHRMDSFCAALAKNSSLNSIDISGNENITIDGLKGFGKVFLSIYSGLKHIRIGALNDEKAVLLAGFLSSRNCKLESISSGWSSNERVTHVGWKAFEKTLCNDESIMATYNSNHTLHLISQSGWSEHGAEEKLCNLLLLNEKWVIPSYCARLKILDCHFSGRREVDVKPFFDLPMELLPFAISWIGAAYENDMNESRNLMYTLVRSMPSLFSLGGKRKRKRTKQRKLSDYFRPHSMS